MNITESKYFIYTLKGILKDRVDFSDMVRKYGNPRQVSNNGMVYIFKKTQNFKLNVILLSQGGLTFVKTIHIKDAIHNYIEHLQIK